jgi:hypothetical protein
VLVCLPILIMSWLFSGAKVPHFNDFSNVQQINVQINPHIRGHHFSSKYETKNENGRIMYEKCITNKSDIDAIAQTMWLTWDGFFPLHSYESGHPTYSMQIIRVNREKEHFFFSDVEWGMSGYTPEALVSYIKKLFSE